MSTPILSGSNNKIAVIRAGQSAKSDTFRADMLLNQKFSGVQRYVIPPTPPATYFKFQGVDYGYVSGGGAGPPNAVLDNSIEKFPFATFTTSTNIGDQSPENQTSKNQGWTSGDKGYSTGWTGEPVSPAANLILQFPFSSETMSVAGTSPNFHPAGGGFNGGHAVASDLKGGAGYHADDAIRRFPFATAVVTVISPPFPKFGGAGPSGTAEGRGGCTDNENGYGYVLGAPGSYITQSIRRWAFASDTVLDYDHGQGGFYANTSWASGEGNSSETHGFIATRGAPVQSWPFAAGSPVAATSVGPPIGGPVNQYVHPTGVSSTTFGFQAGGGGYFGAALTNEIKHFPFSNPFVSWTEVGTLSTAKHGGAGFQV